MQVMNLGYVISESPCNVNGSKDLNDMVYSSVTCIRPLRIASFSVQRMIKARFITAFLIYVKMPTLFPFLVYFFLNSIFINFFFS